MTTFVTADLHLGHTNIIKYCSRPFSGVEEMDTKLISKWNAKVTNDDTVWVLGDFAFSRGAAQLYIGQLNGGKIIFLKGDHDKWLFEEKHPYGDMRLAYHGYMEVFRTDKTWITLCHYPMAAWKASHYNGIDLHGHSHGQLPKAKRRYDVGVDCNKFEPVRLDTLIKKLLVS